MTKSLSFVSKNKNVMNAFNKEEVKEYKKTIAFILTNFKTILEKVPDLKSYQDKVLDLEEEFLK